MSYEIQVRGTFGGLVGGAWRAALDRTTFETRELADAYVAELSVRLDDERPGGEARPEGACEFRVVEVAE
jgi:hypothetical protein